MFDKPSLTKWVSLSVDLHHAPTLADILEAFEFIQRQYPDATPKEVEIHSDINEYEDDYYDDKASYKLCFSRQVPNSNYQKELEEHLKAEANRTKAEYEFVRSQNINAVLQKERHEARAAYKKRK